MTDARTIQVREEGWSIFRGWAQSLAEAQASGEEVPDIQDVDAVVAWLWDHDEIVYPVDTEQARMLIAACLTGGRMDAIEHEL